VDETECACGALYRDFRAYPGWREAADRIRAAARADGDKGAGFRSRGPVLWVMRTIKLERWYMEHAFCREWTEAPIVQLVNPIETEPP
jgi:hypothetical protein